MRNRYKLASALLSSSLIMAACGGGEDGDVTDTNETDVDEVVEDTDEHTEDPTGDDTTEESGTDTSEETTDEGGVEETADPTGETTTEEPTDETGVDGTDEDASNDDSGPSGSGDTIALGDINHDAGEAVDEAAGNFDGELKDLELDREDDQWVYKVDMENETEEYEVKLSVGDLSIVQEETENDDDFDTEDHFNYEDAVPAEEAVQTALDETGGDLEGWTLDMDDGQLEYEVEVKNADGGDADVTINAESGEVIEIDD